MSMQLEETDSSNGRVVVIGAGPAGLTAAYELAKAGRNPIVLEKSHTVGGLSRTESYKGFYFDMGGHRFFTKSKAVSDMWREVLTDEFLQRPRLSRIFYKKRFFHYPLKPINVLSGLGLIESVRIFLSYVWWHLFPFRIEETFEHWVTNRFGQRLFLNFFKTYTEKVWGIPCSELKAEWAAQRIKDLSLKQVVLSMFRKPGTSIKTLIEQFEYPRLGPGMMWKAVAKSVEDHGGEVRINHDVIRICRDGNCVSSIVVASNGCTDHIEGDEFVSTMPITDLVKKLAPEAPQAVLDAAGELKYRAFLTVCLIVDQQDLFDDNWIYIHDPTVKVGRIQNYKNWSPDMVPDSNKTGLGLEYFCDEGDDLWSMSDEDLIELAKGEIHYLGLANRSGVEDGCVFRVAKSYPVYDSDYREHLAVLREFVEGLDNLQTIGRNGLHRYNNQDHAMLTGMLAVSNILEGTDHDLWNVNADQEYHEEVEVQDNGDVLVEEAIASTFLKIDRYSFGMATGVTAGIGLFMATMFLVLKGGEAVGPTLGLLRYYFPGYTVSPTGSCVGLVYGMVVGFSGGWIYALLRNAIVFAYLRLGHRRLEREAIRDLFDHG